MDIAVSIRYGGALVKAEDCNYDSFATEGLICPCCKKSVFLVGEHERKEHQRKGKKVKKATVHPHFNHHSETEKEAILACEFRVKSLTATEKSAYEHRARNQRRKILQANMWNMITSSFLGSRIEEQQSFLENIVSLTDPSSKVFNGKLLENLMSRVEKDFKAYIRNMKSSIELDKIMDSWLMDPHKYVIEDSLFMGWKANLDKKMQTQITKEAIDFLCQRMQSPMLQKLLKSGVHIHILLLAKFLFISQDKELKQKYLSGELKLSGQEARSIAHSDLGFEGDPNKMRNQCVEVAPHILNPTEEQYEEIFLLATNSVLHILSLVDWPKGFEEVEKRRKAAEAAKQYLASNGELAKIARIKEGIQEIDQNIEKQEIDSFEDYAFHLQVYCGLQEELAPSAGPKNRLYWREKKLFIKHLLSQYRSSPDKDNLYDDWSRRDQSSTHKTFAEALIGHYTLPED